MSKPRPATVRDLPAPIIAREGWPIVAGFVLGSVAVTVFSGWGFGLTFGWIVGVLTGVIALWSIWFFRDPRRRIPLAAGGREPIVSPADGVICDIKPCSPPVDLHVPFDAASRMTRVSVFMNVFNVHVNRAPTACTVVATSYTPGKFFNASFDKASEHNERMALRLRLPDGREMACVQIAGMIARRIVCRVKQGAKLGTGERFGIIRFGSRVDVYLPADIKPEVKVGDKTVAGVTLLGWLEPKAAVPAGSVTTKPAERVAAVRR